MGRRKTAGAGRNRERGATVVEFAVIVVLLLVIVFGVLEYAFIFFQEHFIANAAREGMRVGVRADNFNCFDGKPAAGCTANLDRKQVVTDDVSNYLAAIYRPADIQQISVERVTTDKSIRVTVTVNNFFPPILSALIPGVDNPATLSFSTTGRYEDPDEFDLEDNK